MKLAAFSEITRDYFPQFDHYCLGGNALNYAINFKGHTDSTVAIVGAVGTDAISRFILENIKKHNLDTSYLHQIAGVSAHGSLRVDEAGERYGIDGSWNGGVYDKYLFTEDDWKFINTFDCAATTAYDPNFLTACEKLNNRVKLSVDFLHLGDMDLCEKYIDKIAVAFFEGDERLFPNAKKLACTYPQVPIIITMGAKGSRGFLGNEEFYCPAPTVKKVVDTTGCGDSYQAGFSYSWYAENDVRSAMECGTKAAEKTLGHLGGVL